MDRQIFNIKLLSNGDIQLKTGKIVTPCNRVLSLNTETVELVVNKRYIVTIDTSDYFDYALWANRLTMEHADIRKGIVAVDTGFTHKSVSALIMHTEQGQRVGYRDGTHLNLKRSNLYIIGN